MNKFEKKLNSLAWKARTKATISAHKVADAMKNEDGDTNFLSIIIILAIVLVVAVVFIALKDKIIKLVEDAWNKFADAFTGQDGNFDGKTPVA